MPDPIILPANPAIGPRGDLHLYLPGQPVRPGGPHPFIFAIHGGGWTNGDQTSYQHFLPRLAPLGVAVILASYRLVPEGHPFPAAYDDLIASLGWLKAHGKEHQLDTDRCGLIGSSAGGHLTMLLASRGIAEGHPLPHIRAAAEYCGILDLTAQYEHDIARESTMTIDFLQGRSPAEAPELYRAASPIAHLHANMPPLWITHGSADPIVPMAQTLGLLQRLRALQHDVIFHEARGLDHTFRETTPTGEVLDPMELLFEHDLLRFFQRTLLAD